MDTYRSMNGKDLVVNPFDAHPNELAHKLAAAASVKHIQKHTSPKTEN